MLSCAEDGWASHAEPDQALSFPAPRESIRVVRFLLAAAAAAGANARRLAFEARVPAWALADEGTMIPSCHALRLWELAEQTLQDPDVALGVAARYQLGELGLYDYLFRTAATLREGLDASRRYLALVTTNGRLRAETRTGRETTYSYSYAEADGRGQELALQFSIALFCARARAGTGRPVAPVHVGFAQPAPRCHRAFIDAFGTRRIDFGPRPPRSRSGPATWTSRCPARTTCWPASCAAAPRPCPRRPTPPGMTASAGS
jgi:hypothetical protein